MYLCFVLYQHDTHYTICPCVGPYLCASGDPTPV